MSVSVGARAPGSQPGRLVRSLLLLVAVWIGAACARAVTVETDRTALAAIEVYNQAGVAMIVAYDVTGAGRATLGSVLPGSTERFIITLPAGSEIRVFGTSEGGGRISGPHLVTLQGGATQRITLR
jgi:hypothetical protein